jgi:hypothetical protein
MFKITTAIVGATLALTISACGGGGSSQATPATAKKAVSLPIKLAWRGDSIDHGSSLAPECMPSGRCSPTPAQLLQADLDAKFGPGVVLIVDQSAPGSTLKQDLTGTGFFAANEYGTGQPLATVLATADQDFSGVINDSEVNDQFVEGDTPDDFRTDLQNYITTVRAAGMVPIFIEPTAIAPTALNSPGENGTFMDSSAYVVAEHAAANQYGVSVAPMYAAFVNYPAWNVTLVGPDGVHPTPAGYAFRESQLLPTVVAAVEKMVGS